MSQKALKQAVEKSMLISTNPARAYEILGEVEIFNEGRVQRQVAKARKAQAAWWRLGLEKRIQHLKQLNGLFQEKRDELVTATSLEMGMPKKLSESIVDGGIYDLNWNCDHATVYLKNEVLFEDDNEVNEVVYEPHGVMACIVAWNFPFGNFVTSVSQALLAGNTVVMKYSEEVPLFSRYFESIIKESELPDGIVNFVYGNGHVGSLLADQEIDFLSFTGSSQTGQKIYQKAAEKLIPVTLELGGSSPGIIFKDCELTDQLIETLFWARFLNSAQFCDGMKRLIVHKSHFEECVEKLARYAETKKIGDPMDLETELGPLVAERQVVKLEAQIKQALDKGAKLHCGGKRPAGLQGAYYEPTILSNISKDMRVWREEVFGPALPVVSFDSYEEAISLANDTHYGLSGRVFTPNKALARQALLDIKAGSVNTQNAHGYRPQNPFGGYKHSGIGRQGGKFGFHQACQTKVLAWAK